jgi:isopenicillin-N epimerase
VLAAQQSIRDEIERQPSRFMLRELSHLIGTHSSPTRLRQAAETVAAFVGARACDLVFTDNATTGANAVLRSVALDRGDEILVTDHGYGASLNVARFVARERHARIRMVAVPYPEFDAARLLDAVRGAIGRRTRVAVLDHITSESALIFPVKELTALCRERRVKVLVDGAHAPGVLPLDVPSLGADWYIANLHKWAHAPRGCGFLWADPSSQTDLHPAVISWGLDRGFLAEFDWGGTRDPSAWLSAPEGIAFLKELGLDELRRYNHDLVWRAATMLTERWGTTLGVPESSVGFMVTVALPAVLGRTGDDAAKLRDALLFEDSIEVQVHAAAGCLWTRVSAQVYNDWSDIERLARAVAQRSGRP